MLTWIINLIKWNAGHTKYKFDENALSGHRVMNNALIASHDHQNDGQDEEYGSNRALLNAVSPDQNTYGIMMV